MTAGSEKKVRKDTFVAKNKETTYSMDTSQPTTNPVSNVDGEGSETPGGSCKDGVGMDISDEAQSRKASRKSF